MSDPTRQDEFEVYPYAQPEQPPVMPPPAEDPGTALAQPSATPPRDPFGGPSMDRRGLVLGLVGLGVAGLIGVSVVNSENQAGGPYPEYEWPEEQVPVDDPDDAVWILLQTTEGDLGLGVPNSWEVLREGDLGHLRTDDGCELVARVPEPPVRAGEAQLRLEAEYTRARFQAEFTPDEGAMVEELNDEPYEQFSLTSTGTADGAAAEEYVTYLVDTDRERGLVVAIHTLHSAPARTVGQARSMAAQLAEEFRSL